MRVVLLLAALSFVALLLVAYFVYASPPPGDDGGGAPPAPAAAPAAPAAPAIAPAAGSKDQPLVPKVDSVGPLTLKNMQTPRCNTTYDWKGSQLSGEGNPAVYQSPADGTYALLMRDKRVACVDPAAWPMGGYVPTDTLEIRSTADVAVYDAAVWDHLDGAPYYIRAL